ncbi:hypothetical protein N657DRAFT_629216 [Parathielavia appendiculata]|uniref:Uncharacterized protein n=1 Tax=Parathielavia appendiculata TaxID=2587402 RepID=A0AAN6Z7N0_9PEZI|nr:hypothetical protein N657DRAFT_629216 [Parathielavia appendiculata]
MCKQNFVAQWWVFLSAGQKEFPGEDLSYDLVRKKNTFPPVARKCPSGKIGRHYERRRRPTFMQLTLPVSLPKEQIMQESSPEKVDVAKDDAWDMHVHFKHMANKAETLACRMLAYFTAKLEAKGKRPVLPRNNGVIAVIEPLLSARQATSRQPRVHGRGQKGWIWARQGSNLRVLLVIQDSYSANGGSLAKGLSTRI